MRVGTDFCMYEGIQWLNDNMLRSRGNYSIERFARDMNPDSDRIRVTANRVTRFVLKVAAATEPGSLDFECFPPEGQYSPNHVLNAQIVERITNSMIDSTSYLTAARDANHMRCVAGTAGIGFHIDVRPRALDVNGRPVSTYDQILTAFTFQPQQLTLDPHCQERDLHRHDFVCYSEVMTAKKIRRVYGVQLDEDELLTVAQLTPIEHQFNILSQQRLFSKYRQHSHSKGALVHQVHVKDDDGRFGRMYLCIEVPNREDGIVPNFEAAESPFGGDGLPLALLHGHRRSDSMWSLSDAAMCKDDQDRLNLISTFLFRQLQKNAGFQWLVAEDAMKPEAEAQIKNTVAGVIRFKNGTRDRPIPPPQIVQYPPPQPMLADMASQAENSMREQTFRSEGSFGMTKSHVPDSSFQRALEEADQVASVRIRNDIAAHERMAMIGTETVLRLAQQGSPTVLANLSKHGFGVDEFAIIAGIEPGSCAYKLKLRESSIRYRPPSKRKEDLITAVQLQAVSPMQFRMEMASGNDQPITQDDSFYMYEAQKAAMQVVAGGEWEPKPLGSYTEMFINEFRKAMLSEQAKADPQTQQRLMSAIIAQQALATREQMLMQVPEAGAQAGAGVPQNSADTGAQDVESLLASIDAQSGAAAVQPQPAMA